MNRWLIGCFILFFSSSLFAKGDRGEQFYIGVGAYQLNASGEVDDIQLDDSDSSAAVFVGYKLSYFFAVEVGYYDLGSYSDTKYLPAPYNITVDVDYEVDAWTLGFNLILPLKVVDLYAKLGTAAVNKESSVSNDIFLDNDNSLETYVGLGGNLNITSHIDVYAEYSRYFADEVDIDTVGAGVRLLF
jgi:hypothetical protein